MKLLIAQFFASLIGGLLLINSQHVEPHLEGWFIVSGIVIMSVISNWVGQKQATLE